MPTPKRRWSRELEGQRGGSEDAARECSLLAAEIERKADLARAALLNNPTLAERHLIEIAALAARAEARAERIVRMMVEAKERGLDGGD